MVCFSSCAFIFNIFIKLTVYSFLKFSNPYTAGYFDVAFNSFFLIILVMFIFLCFNSFIHKNKVWASIGDTFHLIKRKKITLLKVLGSGYLVILLVSVLMGFIQKRLYFSERIYVILVSLIVTLTFFAWLRVFLLESLKS